MLFFIFAALIPAALPEPVKAQSELLTMELQPDAAQGWDSFIDSSNVNVNSSEDTTMLIGETESVIFRGVIAFDFSTLPADAGITSAVLSLFVAEDLSSNTSTLQAFTIQRDWSESYVTWNNYNDGLAWETAGALGESDILGEPAGEIALPSSLTQGTRVDIPLAIEDVNNMVRDNYFGFMLKTEIESNDAFGYYTSDDANSAMRPKLTIEYDPSPPIEDSGWTCVDPYCSPLTAGVPITPFEHIAPPNWPSVGVYYGNASEGNQMIGAKMLCEPYPLCKNDYPIYYRIEFTVDRASSNPISWSNAYVTLAMSGGSNIAQVVQSCGQNSYNTCSGVMQGVIQPEQISPTDESADFQLKMGMNVPTEWPTWSSGWWHIYLSRTPFTNQCSDVYMVPSFDVETIDPTIEYPAGMVGDETPVDLQGYPTVIDAVYMVRVADGPWNDGTDDRYDTAISTDGLTYQSIEEFALNPNVVCYDVDPLNQYYLEIYFTAPTETFYIRVNDIAGTVPSDFENNSNSPLTPLNYTIGIAIPLTSCESQFSYDPIEDNIASVSVHSELDDTPANDQQMGQEIIGGDWYAIEVAWGSWRENTPIETRIDMEFKFSIDVPTEDISSWVDLADGSPLVYCTSLNGLTVFIQSPLVDDMTLHLRVNDQDVPYNFIDNTGTLGVNIYHTTYTHVPTGCETEYGIDDLVSSGDFRGDQSNGKSFGNSFTGSVGGVSTSYYMTLGAWYMLETKGGPLVAGTTSGIYTSGQQYYDVTLRSGTEGDWAFPADWEMTSCAVTIDALGHQRIFFRIPDNEGVAGAEHFIRAAAASVLGGGNMSWDLYQATEADNPDDPWNTCLNDYGTLPQLNHTWIPVKQEGGAIVTQYSSGGGLASLSTDLDYWLTTSNGPWSDGETEDNQYDAQLSSDDGLNWYLFGEHPDITCAVKDQLGYYSTAVFHTVAGQVWKIRVADTETEVFSDNGGSLAYSIYEAVDPVDPPNDPYPPDDTDFDTCSASLIKPVFADVADFATPTLIEPVTPETWDVVDWVTYLGAWINNGIVFIGEWFSALSEYYSDLLHSVSNFIGGWGLYGLRSTQVYFAWCPRHVNIILVAMHELESKEPLASVDELNTAADNTIAELKSYDWGAGGEGGGGDAGYEDTSIFSFGEGGGADANPNVVNTIVERLIPSKTSEGYSVWDGGDAVNFSRGSGLPDYYYTCNSAFADYLPARLRDGACFASAYWKETGAAFLLQLIFDILTIFMLIGVIKGGVQSLVYMMTGVRPWTKEGAIKVIETVGQGENVIRPVDEWRRDGRSR